MLVDVLFALLAVSAICSAASVALLIWMGGKINGLIEALDTQVSEPSVSTAQGEDWRRETL